MSESDRTDKFNIIGLVVICFGLLAFSIPVICGQLMPTVDVSLFDAPGQNVLNLTNSGAYILYREKFLDDEKAEQEISREGAERLKITVTPADKLNAEPLELESIQNEYIYRQGRRKGISMYRFTVKNPGQYTLRSYYSGGSPGPKLRMTLGPGTINSASMRRTILLLIASVNGAMVIIVLFLVRKMLEK